MSPLVISIEGGIGVGKSTLFAKLKATFKENVSIAFVSEPAEEWTNHGFLQGMYDGTINRATFQHMVLMSLTADLLKALKKKPDVIISERSPWGNRVFAKANLEGKDLKMYEFTWQRVCDCMPPLHVKHVYLRAPIECLQLRTDKRARDGESNIPTAYIRLLGHLHDEWLAGVPNEPEMVVIDASKTEDKILNDVLLAIAGWLKDATHVEFDSR